MAKPKLWFGRHLSGRLLYDKRKQRKKLAREISRKIYARQRVYDRIMMQGYARTVSHSLMKGVGLMELVFLVISLVVLWKIFSDAKK